MSDTTITGIDIHVYLVRDADRAIAFWRDVVGLPVLSEYPGRGAEFELADGSTFGLWKPEGDQPWQAGNGIMFAVPDLDATVARLREQGAKISPHVEESPVCRMAFGEDTEGNAFILHRRR